MCNNIDRPKNIRRQMENRNTLLYWETRYSQIWRASPTYRGNHRVFFNKTTSGIGVRRFYTPP